MLALNSFLKIGQGELANWPRRLYEVSTDVAVDLADGDGAGRREARHRRSACSVPSCLARDLGLGSGDSGFPIPARNGARARHRRRGNVGGKGGASAAAEATGGREGGDGWLDRRRGEVALLAALLLKPWCGRRGGEGRGTPPKK